LKLISVITVIILASTGIRSQNLYELSSENLLNTSDTTPKKYFAKKNISALFLGVGGGISVPASPFRENSDVTFGILGRLDFSSTSIFPFVIGGEVTYFSYKGADQFKTVNLLSTFQTKILSYGLNIEYSLSKLLRSSFTMPFISVDVKFNNIKREIDAGRELEGLPREDSKISVGAGFGFTMFILDFHVKYNYMKDGTHIGVYTKTKIPVIRF